MFNIIIAILLFHSIHSLQFRLQQEEQLTYKIPQLFNFQQHSQISRFYNNHTHISTKLCQVQRRSLISQQIQNEQFLKPDWKQQQQARKNEIIYQLQNLQKFQFVLNMVSFNNSIVILFQTKNVSFYQIDESGKFKFDGTNFIQFSLTGQILLRASKKHCLIISENKILKLQGDRSWIEMSGYEKLGQNLKNAKFEGETLYIAGGTQGVFIYSINESALSLNQHHNLKLGDNAVSVQDIARHKQQLFLVDEIFGLLVWKSDKPSNLQKTKIQQKGCTNLIIHQGKAYVSCKKFLKYSIDADEVSLDLEMGLYPQQILINGSQLIFISYNYFGVSDSIQLGYQKGAYALHTEKSIIHNDYVVGMNYLKLTSWKILPAVYYLQCQVSDDNTNIEGKNQAILTVSGQCSNKSEICSKTLDVIINVSYPNGFPVLEIIGSVLFIWCACFCGIWLSVRHIKVRKQYSQLQEEATLVDFKKTDAQISYQTNPTEPQAEPQMKLDN